MAHPRRAPPQHRRPRPDAARAVHGRRRHGRALLRDGLRRGPDPAHAGRRRRASRPTTTKPRPTRSSTCRSRFHGLDVDADRARRPRPQPHDYVARQLRRWKTQVDAGPGPRPPGDRRGPRRARGDRSRRAAAARRSCTATTASTTPCSATTAASIAVLDWELATIGDPVADFVLVPPLLVGPGGRRCRFIDADPDPRTRASPVEPTSSSATRTAPGARPVGARLVHGVRLLEDGLHRRGRLRPPPQGRLRRWDDRRRGRDRRPGGRPPGARG